MIQSRGATVAGTGGRVARASVVARSFVSALRNAWLMVGLTLLLFVGLELLYRAQGAVRRRLHEEPDVAPAHPHAQAPWYKDWVPATLMKLPLRYHPHLVFWPEAHTLKYVHIDSSGRRVTPQSPPASPTPRRVFMLGGSTMWGYSTPDSTTIPALVAARLRARAISDVEVVNLAQISYATTQSVVTLLLELRRGNVPDIAVFLSGTNDLAAGYWVGAGSVPDEQRAVQRWAEGGRSFWGKLAGLGDHSALVTRLRRALTNRNAMKTPPRAVSGCRDIALHYRNLVRSVEGMGREFGFQAVFLWQPMIGTSRKSLTAWEQWLQTRVGAFSQFTRRCAPVGDSVLADRVGRTYFPLHTAFDAETATTFEDTFEHLTEYGNAVIASRIADVIAPMLAAPAASGRRRTRS